MCTYVYMYVFMCVIHRPNSNTGKWNPLIKYYSTQCHLKSIMISWRDINDDKTYI